MGSLHEHSVAVPANFECKVKSSSKYTKCDAIITILSLLVYVADIITGSARFFR